MLAVFKNIYQNPSNGMYTIANNRIESVSVQVINMLGESVYSNSGIVPTESKIIALSNFAKGEYCIVILSEKGVSKKKIVVQ